MEYLNITSYSSTDKGWLQHLGSFIRKTRLEQNKTQEELAASAGMNRTTLSQIEKGNGGTMLSFIRILRVLGRLELLNTFEVETRISPLVLAEQALKMRKRSRPKKSSGSRPESDW